MQNITSMLTTNRLLTATCFLGVKNAHEILPKKMIFDAFQKSMFMKYFKTEIIYKIVSSMYLLEFPEECMIIRNKGTHLFIVEEGEFELEEKYSTLEIPGVIGKIYGEREFMLHGRTRLFLVKGITACKVWFLDQATFRNIMKNARPNTKDLGILKQISYFEHLNIEELSDIAMNMEVKYFGSYETIKIKNDILYIVNNGALKLLHKTQTDGNHERIVKLLSRGQYFESNTKSEYKLIALHPGAELLTISIRILNYVVRNNLFVRRKEIIWSTKKMISINKILEDPYHEMKLNDIQFLFCIGRGSFGRVDFVRYTRYREMPEYFAIKMIEKHRTVNNHQISHVIEEREILRLVKHPFIVRFIKSFRNRKYVYFLTEVCRGGRLGSLLRKKEYFDKETSRFVIGSTVQALDYLHKEKIIHRDLKSDNLIIDHHGYVKLADFGFSKHLGYTGKTWSFCGTPSSIAPEVILNMGQDRAVDLWALGMLVYELLCGCTLFTSFNKMTVYEQILKGVEHAEFSVRIAGSNAEKLVKNICKQVPEDRLGYNTMEDIRNHRWFRDFNWKGLVYMTMKPPKTLIPSLCGPTDMANLADMRDDHSYVPLDEDSNWDKDFE